MIVTERPNRPPDSASILGMAMLVGLAYRQGDVASVWNHLLERYAANPEDAAALMDMSIVLQTVGQRSKALELQQKALQLRRCYHRPDGSGMKVLVFVTEGDFMVNTPIEFLMEGSDATLYLYYVDAGTRDMRDAPEHDVAFAAIGESEANVPVLENLARLLEGWRRPVVNLPQRILTLKRNAVSAMFADEASIMAPRVARVDRRSVESLARGEIELCELLPGGQFPIVLRPFDFPCRGGAGEAGQPGRTRALSWQSRRAALLSVAIRRLCRSGRPLPEATDRDHRRQAICRPFGHLEALDGSLPQFGHAGERGLARRRSGVDARLRHRLCRSPRAGFRGAL